MGLTFTNPDTVAKFEATVTRDRTIHVPGKYSGKLSAIPPEIADALIAMEDNQVKPKKATATPAKPPKDAPDEEAKK